MTILHIIATVIPIVLFALFLKYSGVGRYIVMGILLVSCIYLVLGMFIWGLTGLLGAQ